jgi:AcrR family transcriptional regulator
MARNSRTDTVMLREDTELLELRSQPAQERSRKTVVLILETAAELVDEVGVVGFTTNLLAERAGIRVRTIYRYFPSKIGILSALMIHLDDDSEDRLKLFSDLGDAECDWRKLIGRWLDDLSSWTRERPGARLLMGWSHAVPELVALGERIDEEWVNGMIEAMTARGVDLPARQLYAVCHNFIATLDSMTSLAASTTQEYSEEIIEETRCMLVLYLEHYLD